jgi:hypothetical protein
MVNGYRIFVHTIFLTPYLRYSITDFSSSLSKQITPACTLLSTSILIRTRLKFAFSVSNLLPLKLLLGAAGKD